MSIINHIHRSIFAISHRNFQTSTNFIKNKRPFYPFIERQSDLLIESSVKSFENKINFAPNLSYVREPIVQKVFSLSPKQINDLNIRRVKTNPFEGDEGDFVFFNLAEVLSITQHSNAELTLRFRHYMLKDKWKPLSRRIYGMDDVENNNDTSPITETKSNKFNFLFHCNRSETRKVRPEVNVLYQGLLSNLVIFSAKLCTFLVTRSFSIFADAMHSGADVGNYLYRLKSMRLIENEADHHHPYGYSKHSFIAADRTFFSLGIVGGLLPLFSSSQALFTLILAGGISGTVFTTLTFDWLTRIAISMFLMSGFFEFIAARTAYLEIKKKIKKEPLSFPQETAGDSSDKSPSLFTYLKNSSDLMTIATFLEGGVGVFGAITGIVGILSSVYFGSILPDVISGMIMSLSVLGTSGFLLSKSTNSLLGSTLDFDHVINILVLLEKETTVWSVYDVKTEILGPNRVRFKAEVEFNTVALSQKKQPHSNLLLQNDDVSEEFKTDCDFYLILTEEIKKLETIIRGYLMHSTEFEEIHVDLEPW